VSGLTLSKGPVRSARPVGGIRKWWHSRLGAPLLLEIVIVITLLLIYKGARLLAEGDVNIAKWHAHQVIDFERALGIFNEENVQRIAMKSTAVIRFLNVYYLWAHFSVTIAMLVWLYVKKPLGYLSVRRVLVVVTALGLIGHALYPLAPPRLVNGFGFVDTAALFGPNSYGAKGTYGNLANQFAAMPSLHFAWAVVVAWGVVRFAKSRWRYLATLHPILTLLAIVLTANHYWTDAAVGLILVPIGILGDRYLPHWQSKHQHHLADTPPVVIAAEDARELTRTS
jgi:PAP2 superfamily protein